MTEYNKDIILELFDLDGDGQLNSSERGRFEAVVALGSMDREKFYRQPKEMRDVFYELWCDKILTENANSQSVALEESTSMSDEGIEDLII